MRVLITLFHAELMLQEILILHVAFQNLECSNSIYHSKTGCFLSLKAKKCGRTTRKGKREEHFSSRTSLVHICSHSEPYIKPWFLLFSVLPKLVFVFLPKPFL